MKKVYLPESTTWPNRDVVAEQFLAGVGWAMLLIVGLLAISVTP